MAFQNPCNYSKNKRKRKKTLYTGNTLKKSNNIKPYNKKERIIYRKKGGDCDLFFEYFLVQLVMREPLEPQ